MGHTRYELVVSSIIRQIRTGKLKPGDKLQSEHRLAKEMMVSRSTIREGLRQLQNAGYLKSKNGVGSFVQKTACMVQNQLNSLRSIGTMIEDAGYQARTEERWVKHLAGEAEWCKALQLPVGAPVVAILRERWANDCRIAVVLNIFPEELVGNALDNGISVGVFHSLETLCGIVVQYAVTQFKALDPQNSGINDADNVLGGPILLMEQLHFDAQDRPVFFSLDYVRTDMMKLVLRRERMENL